MIIGAYGRLFETTRFERNTFVLYLKEWLRQPIYVFILLYIFGGCAYLCTTNAPMLFDDDHFIVKNETVHALGNIGRIYTSSVTEGAHISGNFYRPNQQLVYALIYHFGKLSPVPYHLTSILLHLLNAYLLFFLLRRLEFLPETAFLTSLLFLIHPVQTEAVSYISGLADPLGSFWLLSGLLFFLKTLTAPNRRSQIGLTLLMILTSAMALLSKENMVVILPLAALLAVFRAIHQPVQQTLPQTSSKKRPSREILPLVEPAWRNPRLLLSLAIMSGMTGLYLFMKLSVFSFTGRLGLTTETNIYTEHLWVRFCTFISIIWQYFRLIFWPWDLSYEKPYQAFPNLYSPGALFGLILIGIWLVSLLKIRRLSRLFFGLTWFFLALLPYTGIIPLNAMFLEHWLYLPIIGILSLVVWPLEYLILKQRRRTLTLLLIIVIGLLMARTISRNREWSDIEKFYLNELKYTQSSARIFNNLGMYYADKNDSAKAIEYYQKAIATWDVFPQSHHNLANIYLASGRIEEAIKELHLALRLDPNFPYSLSKLLEVFDVTRQVDRAEQAKQLLLRIQAGQKNDPAEIEALFR
jgi:hypothetical protein